MNAFKDARNIVITVLVLIVAYKFLFPTQIEVEKPVITTITKTDTAFVTVKEEVPVYVPEIHRVIDTVYVPIDVDTLAVVEDYFREYIYTDTLQVDSLGIGIVEDTVTQNRIVSRSVNWDYKIPIITETVTTTIQLPPVKKNQIYLGATMNVDPLGINYIGPNLGFRSKNGTFITGGVGLTESGLGYSFGMHYKFFDIPRLRDIF